MVATHVRKITGAGEDPQDAMPEAKLGQQWDIYSIRGRAWHRVTVSHIEGDRIVLRSADKQFHECLKGDLADPNIYRFVSDVA
jgi:hypothetical protein